MFRLIVVLFCLLAAILVMTSAQIQGYPGGQNGGFNTANQNSFATPNIPFLQYLLMQRYFD